MANEQIKEQKAKCELYNEQYDVTIDVSRRDRRSDNDGCEKANR